LDIDEDTLKEMGVMHIGARKRLSAAIRTLAIDSQRLWRGKEIWTGFKFSIFMKEYLATHLYAKVRSIAANAVCAFHTASRVVAHAASAILRDIVRFRFPSFLSLKSLFL